MGSVREQIQEIVDQGDLSISAIARSSGSLLQPCLPISKPNIRAAIKE